MKKAYYVSHRAITNVLNTFFLFFFFFLLLFLIPGLKMKMWPIQLYSISNLSQSPSHAQTVQSIVCPHCKCLTLSFKHLQYNGQVSVALVTLIQVDKINLCVCVWERVHNRVRGREFTIPIENWNHKEVFDPHQFTKDMLFNSRIEGLQEMYRILWQPYWSPCSRTIDNWKEVLVCTSCLSQLN